jgi:anti-sigma B factor antagonist
MITSRDDLPSYVSVVFRDNAFHAVCLRCGTFLGSDADIRILKLSEERHNCVKALNIDETPTEVIVHCTGRVTSHMTEVLRATVKPLISQSKTVVLDLTDVSYVDSSGLGAIVGLYVSAKVAGRQLKFINLNERVKELFRLTKLGDLLVEGCDPNLGFA